MPNNQLKKKVLVFPCGSEVGLEIYRSLKYSKDFELYGASSVSDHGEYVYENYIDGLPFVESPDFIHKINDIINEYKIDYIFPAHDSVVLKLAENKNELLAIVLTSPANTCKVARSKKLTYETLKDVVGVPRMYELQDDFEYPVFLKPDVGQGSKGTLKANSKNEIISALKKDSTLLILEYLPGEEYTVDCFTDFEGNLLFSRARSRSRIMNGISVRSNIVAGAEFDEFARSINERLQFKGVWFFQVKRNSSNQLVLMEIAPRVAGTMALTRVNGCNLPLLTLYLFMNRDFGDLLSISKEALYTEVDRSLYARYKPIKIFKNYIFYFKDEDEINFLAKEASNLALKIKNYGYEVVLFIGDSKYKKGSHSKNVELLEYAALTELKVLRNLESLNSSSHESIVFASDALSGQIINFKFYLHFNEAIEVYL